MRLGRILLLAWLVTVGLGTYLRVAGLGDGYLFVDDLNHHFAAQSLRAGEGPRLPSGRDYVRGMDLTRMVSVSQRYVDDPELADRLPAAVFGVLNLIVFAVVASRMAGPWAGLFAVLLLAIYPEAVHQSRQVRFYTYQLNFGLLAMYAGWRAVESAGRLPAERPGVGRTWLWLAGAMVAFALALRVQLTSGSALAAFGVVVLLAAAWDAAVLRGAAWRRSALVQAAVLGLAGTALVVVAAPGLVADLWHTARSIPENFGAIRPAGYYVRRIAAEYPLLALLTPVAVLAGLLTRPRVTLYALLWFLVPLVLHSLVFVWKAERYILLAMPGLFLLWGLGLAALVERVAEFARRRLPVRWSGPAAAPVLTAAVASLLALPILRTPAGWHSRQLVGPEPDYKRDDWNAAARVLARLDADGDLPVGASLPIVGMMYRLPLDFDVHQPNNGGDEAPIVTEAGTGRAGGAPRDYYSGLPKLTTPEAIRAYFADADTALIVIDSTRWAVPQIVDSTLRRTLTAEAEEVCRGQCGRLMVFVWPLTDTATTARLAGRPGETP